MRSPQLFNSYWQGGFECADHINRHGERVNLLQETEHDLRVVEDYALLTELGIFTVREGICWSNVEKSPGIYDFSEVWRRMRAAQNSGIQQIWDLIHFGYPDGLFPTHPHFAQRFEQLCRAFARFYTENSSEQLFVVPINEISFLSWLSGENRGTVPFAIHNGCDIKYHLCKAAIQGIRVLKEEAPDCRIVMVEPLIEIHSHGGCPVELQKRNEYQFEAMDIIGGRMCPELGGQEEFLDILGFNYYWNCQWRGDGDSLCWPDDMDERIPVHQLLLKAYERYGKPMFISETGHFGQGRAEWIAEIANESRIAAEMGVDLHGICIYPVTDRPDWDDLSYYSNCGIFDLDAECNRIPDMAYVDELRRQPEFHTQREPVNY
ncbi:hypothetical protein J8J42_10265 [Chryseobacterium sp. cx-311]|uniref:hypothetical protein n=1 Tax=Marnyiella aurantia TaxID=2758037 RepID=UPI001AE1C7D6|nr:hypothetical protein [Marnyiella aurantia]MBP0613429.1 hypothetical protein [Marnyiella aurantia]